MALRRNARLPSEKLQKTVMSDSSVKVFSGYGVILLAITGYICLIFILSSLPSSYITFSDSKLENIVSNLAHIPIYGLLAGLLFLGLKKGGNKSNYLLSRNVFIISMVIAVLDELNQYTVQGRTSSLLDILLDGTGVIIALWLARTRWGIAKLKTE